jgi:predicted enzyme related to lactoylglutathione lyase
LEPALSKTVFTSTKIVVKDLERSLAFYKELAGLQDVARVRTDRIEEIILRGASGAPSLVLIRYHEPKTHGDAVELVFATDDLEAFSARLERGGGKITDPPKEISANGATYKLMFGTDPDGNVVEGIYMP